MLSDITMGRYRKLDDAIGKVISSVSVNQDKMGMSIRFADGEVRKYAVYGECCSESWIEHVEIPPDISGATLIAVIEHERSGTDEELTAADAAGHGDVALMVYQTIFRTDRGDMAVEYRNSSNGYYGGWLMEVD